MFSNKRVINKGTNLRWSGNTIGTKYTETVILESTHVKIANTRPRPVTINLTLALKNLVDGSSSPKDTKTYVSSLIYYEARKSGSSTWKTLAQVQARSMVQGDADIKNSARSARFNLTHRISADDAGVWEYRARLVTTHRNGNSGNLSAASVYVTVIANLTWSKN
jgi:hypothetical protein